MSVAAGGVHEPVEWRIAFAFCLGAAVHRKAEGPGHAAAYVQGPPPAVQVFERPRSCALVLLLHNKVDKGERPRTTLPLDTPL